MGSTPISGTRIFCIGYNETYERNIMFTLKHVVAYDWTKEDPTDPNAESKAFWKAMAKDAAIVLGYVALIAVDRKIN